MLERFVAHRRDVVTRRTRFELKQARAREHILLGYQIALDHIDEIIELIKKAADRDIAREQMMQRFGFSELQAKAILEMQLQRLTGLERQKILDELAEVQALVTRLKEILGSEKVLMQVIVDELKEVRQLFADARRTEIQGEADDLEMEDLIAEEEMVVTVSHAGYVKRNPVSLYRAQRRGGRGKTGAGAREEDFLESLFVASTHSYLFVFSDKGKVYWLKVHEIPQASRAARGKPIVNLVQLAPGEKVAAILPVRQLPEPTAGADEALEAESAAASETVEKQAVAVQSQFVFLCTKKGIIKKTRLDAFSRPRAAGIIALGIEEGDALIAARLTDGASNVLLSTARGMAIRFEETDVRPMGRGAYGVKGITLDDGDEVVSAEVVAAPREGEPAPAILTVTANGYGKRTELAEYRVQSRGGKGIITIKTTERNGPVVAAISMLDTEEVMLITNKGMLIRMPAKGISVIGRNTQGVRLITVESREEQVAGVARVAETTPEAEAVEGRDPDDGEPGVDGEGPADGGRGGGAPDGEDGGP
jgi:DNA gyrase subunit A